MAFRTMRRAEQTAVLERAKARLDSLAFYERPVSIRRVRILSPGWLFRLPWFRRFDGYTIWSTILLRQPLAQVGEDLITHEAVHVWQGQNEWVRLWISYVKPSTFIGDHRGYWENPYELEARAAVAQTRPAAPTPTIKR
jgi:hypothetical protein